MDFKNIIERIVASLQKITGVSERGTQIALSIIIILMLNFAAATCNMRCDLTGSGTYSLSKKSKEVVRGLQENMKVKVFFSENLPAQHTMVYRYLTDILNEYDYYGSRNFSFEIVPEKDLEQEAADYGIQPVQSQEFAGDQTTLRRTYMGIVIQHADLIEKINALTSTAGLEYELTSRMEKMASKINALLELEKPITVRLYHDSRLAPLGIRGLDSLEQTVRESVEASARVNYGKLVFEAVDTASLQDTEKTAAEYGLRRVQWKAGRTATGTAMPAGQGLLSIVMLNGERFRVIPLELAPSLFGNYTLNGLDGLEESLNDGVSLLLSGSTRIGYLAGHGTVDINDNQTKEGGAVFREILSDIYELVPVDLSQSDVPSDISVLVINGPKGGFSDIELYRLDQYLMAGNSAIIFADRFEEIQPTGNMSMFNQGRPIVLPVTTGLEDLLAAYGVSVEQNIVLDESCAKVNAGQMITDYQVLPIILKDGFSKKSSITKYLNSAAFFKASEVSYDAENLKEKGIDATALISSSKESWIMNGQVDFNPFTIGLNRPADEELKPFALSVKLSGKFKSFFMDKDIPTEGGFAGRLISEQKLNETIGSGTTQIIVTGTSQIARSGFILDARQILAGGGQEGEVYSNELLIHGMIDELSGKDYIIEMKSKSLAYNPIDKTSDNARFVLKTINIAGAPIIVIIAGLFVWRYGLKRRKYIFEKFNTEDNSEH